MHESVTWTGTVRNGGDKPLHDISARFSEVPLAPPFTLRPGEERPFRRDTVFDEVGEKSHTFSATGRFAGGDTVSASGTARVVVRESSVPSAAPERSPGSRAGPPGQESGAEPAMEPRLLRIVAPVIAVGATLVGYWIGGIPLAVGVGIAAALASYLAIRNPR